MALKTQGPQPTRSPEKEDKKKKLSFYGWAHHTQENHCSLCPLGAAAATRTALVGPREYKIVLLCSHHHDSEAEDSLSLSPLPTCPAKPRSRRRADLLQSFSMEHDGEAARRGFGRMGFGCKHYRRRCRIRAPCCNDVFHCRHCHNESTKDGHELDRHAIESVICLVCDTEQPVAQECSHCGVCMGEYFCSTCKFFDDDVDKEHYHCKECGICRVGGEHNFFHCQKCGSCYSTTLRDKHRCIENSMRNNCPICYEYLFDSLREAAVLRCGHAMHLQCFHEMLKHDDKFSCPICSTSVFEMDKFLRALDAEMEETYFYMGKGWIVCNDCRDTTQVYSGGVAGHKCCHCQSYNTCRIAPPVLP